RGHRPDRQAKQRGRLRADGGSPVPGGFVRGTDCGESGVRGTSGTQRRRRKVTMNRLILAEYKKIFFLKFSRRYLLVLVVAGVAFGVVLSLTTRMTTGRHLNELAPHEVLSMNMLGVDLA